MSPAHPASPADAPTADASTAGPTVGRADERPAALYGCMGLGGEWSAATYGPSEIDVAEAAIDAALDVGIVWFDHADIYTGGKAEAVFGEVLARASGLRERIRIQTKCGIRPGAGGRPGTYDLSGDWIVRSVHGSLARLRTDAIDVLMLHRPDPLAYPEAIAAAVGRLRDEGLVRAVGVSNMNGHQTAAIAAALGMPVVADQLEMSLHARGFVEDGVLVNTPAAATTGFPQGTLEYCARAGVALQAWGALAAGRYTGRPRSEADAATGEVVADLARAYGTTGESIVLAWLRRHPAGIAPVIGTTAPARIRACRDAIGGGVVLDRDDWYRLWIAARGAPLP